MLYLVAACDAGKDPAWNTGLSSEGMMKAAEISAYFDGENVRFVSMAPTHRAIQTILPLRNAREDRGEVVTLNVDYALAEMPMFPQDYVPQQFPDQDLKAAGLHRQDVHYATQKFNNFSEYQALLTSWYNNELLQVLRKGTMSAVVVADPLALSTLARIINDNAHLDYVVPDNDSITGRFKPGAVLAFRMRNFRFAFDRQLF